MDSSCFPTGLFFSPSVGLYHEFVQGCTEPCPAYLIAGREPGGYCLDKFDLTVLIPFKATVFDVLFPERFYTSPYSFSTLSFYSAANPTLMVAYAETRFVRAHECFRLKDLAPAKATCYEEDLTRLLSI